MPVAQTPLQAQAASKTTWLVGLAIVSGAGSVLALAPPNSERPQKGDVVSYTEDLVGRPWRVVREHEFGRYVIRNGKVCAIADVHEISPYAGPEEDVTVQMAGEIWRQKVAELRGEQQVASRAEPAVP